MLKAKCALSICARLGLRIKRRLTCPASHDKDNRRDSRQSVRQTRNFQGELVSLLQKRLHCSAFSFLEETHGTCLRPASQTNSAQDQLARNKWWVTL